MSRLIDGDKTQKHEAGTTITEPYNSDKCNGCFGASNNDCEICGTNRGRTET